MSNLSDSEFLLNHSALINLEGDHRSMLCDTFDRRSAEGNIGKLTRQARTECCDILVIYFFIVSRYPMSNLSDSEFLLNHSAEADEILGGLFGRNSTAQYRTQVNFAPEYS